MHRAALLAALLIGAGLAGCIGQDDAEDLGESSLPGEAAPSEVSFQTPLKAAHPDYDLPTFNDPTRNVQGDVPSWWTPPAEAQVPGEITGLSHLAKIEDDKERGGGIAIFGSLAIVTGYVNHTTIYDISDPANPVALSHLEDPPARDADTLAFPDGRLYALFATDTGVVPIFNLTDPENPEKVATIEPERGSHNVAMVPGTPFLYNAASAGGGTGSQVESQASQGTAIYDLSDPTNPELVTDFENGYSCHDITFYMDQDQGKYRAYCAGVHATQIFDIADPTSPEVVVTIPHPHGAPGTPSLAEAPATLSHLAMVNKDASVLIVGDETGGGVAPACDVHAEAEGTSASGPVGNLWFYDISDETSPSLEGWISPTHHYTENPPHDDRLTQIGDAGVPSGCTAHFGHLLPEDGKLAMAFYGAGVLIIDFSDPANPLIVDRWFEEPSTNVWDVWYYQGYLFTGDLARGMDVLELTGE